MMQVQWRSSVQKPAAQGIKSSAVHAAPGVVRSSIRVQATSANSAKSEHQAQEGASKRQMLAGLVLALGAGAMGIAQPADARKLSLSEQRAAIRAKYLETSDQAPAKAAAAAMGKSTPSKGSSATKSTSASSSVTKSVTSTAAAAAAAAPGGGSLPVPAIGAGGLALAGAAAVASRGGDKVEKAASKGSKTLKVASKAVSRPVARAAQSGTSLVRAYTPPVRSGTQVIKRGTQSVRKGTTTTRRGTTTVKKTK